MSPGRVVEPETPESAAALLAEARRERRSVVVRGGGTKMGWGAMPSRPVDVLLGMKRLDRIVAHRHADLTVTVQAGATLMAVNAALAAHGQWLPLDSSFPGATIGGLVATNDSGPSRHRHGTPRDLLIGATLALTDGRLVASGGHVVKNVAGYDLGRLMAGSHGGYAVIVDATFKLMPRSLARATLVTDTSTAAGAAAALRAVTGSQLDPDALDVDARCARGGLVGPVRLLARFASGPVAVEAQVASAVRLVGGQTLAGDDERACWRAQTEAPWIAPGLVARLAWLPADLDAVLDRLTALSGQHGLGIRFTGRAAVGAGFVTLEGQPPAQIAALTALRADPILAHVVVLRAEAPVKAAVAVWGAASAAAGPLRALKDYFDPSGILNPGRGPV